MIGLKRKVGRGAEPGCDPEFTGVGLGKPEPLARARRTLKLLIHAHCITAALTASDQIHYGLRFLATGDVHRHLNDLQFEGISILAFLTVFILPPLIIVTAVRRQIPTREFCWAVLATFGLGCFQFLAILPGFQ